MSYRHQVPDDLTDRYGDLLTGTYDCVDRIVLNAYFSLGSGPGGFRTWWRRWQGNDDDLDDTHLMRMAGRFARRVRGWARANDVPVITCRAGERKHLIAQEHLEAGPVPVGVFLVLVARAPAMVWKVKRSSAGRIVNLEKKSEYVNHYSFHIMDPDWGHVTIKMSGHPPFGAQVILNGHEYVAATAAKAGVDFRKEGNCFTVVPEPARLAQIADTVSQPGTAGRLREVCDRWIYTACSCSGWTSSNRRRAASSTTTRSTRSSTPTTCCSPTAPGCNGSSTPSWTAADPASTWPWCGPCSGPKPGPTETEPAGHLDWQR